MNGPALPRAAGVRVLVTGAAGLLGQNLVPTLKAAGAEVIALDKDREGLARLHRRCPDIRVIAADLAADGGWRAELSGTQALVVAHAQIGGTSASAFRANNVTATERLFAAALAAGVPYAVQIGSSAVQSAAVDWYTESKKAQEDIARSAGIACAILRPTLMFGPFDVKHLGWLARFMAKTPVFPVPGHGRYPRQPLYVQDFCAVVLACLERRVVDPGISVTGLEQVDFIDLMRCLRAALGLSTPILPVPYPVFRAGLQAYALAVRQPVFTASQLAALVTPDLFEVTDWPSAFGVDPTPLDRALAETFGKKEAGLGLAA